MKISNADKWFSRFIRLRDADENGIGRCCTCGTRKEVKQMDCGHYVGRQYKTTRFSENNCHIQCKHCNGFNEGRKVEFRKFLVEKYGADVVMSLETAIYRTIKMGAVELKFIAEHYKAQTEIMLKEKGLMKWW